jgi:hypothetical protein
MEKRKCMCLRRHTVTVRWECLGIDIAKEDSEQPHSLQK